MNRNLKWIYVFDLVVYTGYNGTIPYTHCTKISNVAIEWNMYKFPLNLMAFLVVLDAGMSFPFNRMFADHKLKALIFD